MEKPKHPYDPRKDLVTDHRHWKQVLWNCWHLERDLYYVLHGTRCGGAQLTETAASFRLLPGEWLESEWDEIKQKWLNPVRDKLIEIFMVSRWGRLMTDIEIPEKFIDNPKSPIFRDLAEQTSMFK